MKDKADLPDAQAALVWDEYKYRHDFVWKTVFQLTGAAVVLGSVPYIEAGMVKTPLKYWLLAPPFVGIALIQFARVRLKRELLLLDQVKRLHRARQEHLYHLAPEGSSFDSHVRCYMSALFLLALANVLVGTWYLAAR